MPIFQGRLCADALVWPRFQHRCQQPTRLLLREPVRPLQQPGMTGALVMQMLTLHWCTN